jgi:hypothetical protein
MIESRRMGWAGNVDRTGNRILVGKQEGKRSLRRPRCRRVDNINMDYRERGWCGMDWNDLDQDRD